MSRKPKTPRKGYGVALGNAMAEFEVLLNPAAEHRIEEQRRALIRSAFFVDQLQLSGGPQMTATEVLQRSDERLRLLGPMLGRLQSELLRPLIIRSVGILGRAGRLPPAPPSLLGATLQIDYISPVARANLRTAISSMSKPGKLSISR